MDLKELQENCCCSKCLNCFDEYDHYKWLSFIPVGEPMADYLRYYCNKHHKNVLPDSIKDCFTKR